MSCVNREWLLCEKQLKRMRQPHSQQTRSKFALLHKIVDLALTLKQRVHIGAYNSKTRTLSHMYSKHNRLQSYFACIQRSDATEATCVLRTLVCHCQLHRVCLLCIAAYGVTGLPG